MQTDYKPESVRVYGKKDALENQSSIKIGINIQNAKKDVEKEVSLLAHLNDGINLVRDTETVSVRCEIEKDGQRILTMTPSDIAVKNLPANYTMNFDSEAQKYEVEVWGDEEHLANVNIADLGAYIDLSGLSDGSHTLDVKYSLPSGMKVKNKIKVKIHLRDQNDEVAPITPAPTASSESEDGV